MDFTTALIIIAVIYGTCAHYPYVKFLEGTGFKISILSLKWETKAFNRTLIKWGNTRPRFLDSWFTVGLYASLILLPVATCLNIFLDYEEGTIVIEPIIPGINLPATELGYYSLALIFCSVVHELGHALAAVLEDVNIIDVGANIFFILPVAYVNISTEKFSSLGHKKILKILCAGIWHNLVLAFVGLLIFSSLPFIFSPFYETDKGVTVNNMASHSPLLGPRGLKVGDIITKINECHCFRQLHNVKPAFCIDSDMVHDLDESIPLRHLENGIIECCDPKKSRNFCFEYLDTADGILLELPSHVCLPGRAVVEKSTNFCTYKHDSCSDNQYCFRPLLENTTSLFKIACNGKNVIYVGTSWDIYRTVDVSYYVSNGIFSTTKLPDIVTKIVSYITAFSFGLAIVNVVPVMYMDGQHIADILGDSLLRRSLGKTGAKLTTVIISWIFTFLILVHCVFVVSKIIL
ncbi:hypothetical protein NQ317_007494 [Molorchus minor]|uniref:Membrane-bound transcription factor site-2 protease n=1 Tax=Molorchus minor TaxID=1323400 RepID=A0ABQ9K3V4_9CUCU|nr:hypothetical protein NQ317_007494 [Molorchus minor]